MISSEVPLPSPAFQEDGADRFDRMVAWWKAQTSFRLLLATALPGVPFIVARTLLHQHSGIFNLDFLLLAIAAAAGFRKSAAFLFVLTYLLESLRLLDAVYFFSEGDVAFAAHFLCQVAPWLIAAWVLYFVVLCFVSLRVWQAITPPVNGRQLVLAALPLLVLALAAATVDMHEGFDPLLVLPHGKPRPHLVGEVLLRMPIELSRATVHDTGSTVLLHSATDPLWSAAHLRAAHDNVVVVMVESMGLLTNEAARKREFGEFLEDPAVLTRYSVEEGSIPFTGATIVGEMRELCHLRTGVHIESSTLAGKAPCLPAQFRSMGFETAAFHGYRGTMFARRAWYPKLGFQKTNFAEEMAGLAHCGGAFYGVCDTAIAADMERRLVVQRQTGTPPQFLYWMTLNSHLPIDLRETPVRPCPIVATREVCGQLGLIGSVLDSVRKLVLDPAIGPTTVVIVGDHAPPYADYKNRDLFDKGSVPYLVLQPRT